MKILVIRFSSLGDVVLISPLFQKIKHLFPDAHLTFLTDIRYVKLFNTDPNIDRIIPYEVSCENLMYLILFLNKVRKERYDIVIDCHIIPRSLLFLLFCRAVKRLRLKKFSFERRRMVKLHNRKRIPHIVNRYLATIEEKDTNDYNPKIYLNKNEITKFGDLLMQKKKERKIIGFAPGASKRTKVWQLQRLRNLAFTLTENDNVYIIFFGEKNEIPFVRDINEGLNDTYLDLTGKTDVRELALFLEGCDVLFTTDSGPMHIAVAVGTPVVAIFGPTVSEFGFTPYDKRSVVVSKPLHCRPCSLHGTDTCPLGHHKCMELIGVEEVRKEIKRLLHQTHKKDSRQ